MHVCYHGRRPAATNSRSHQAAPRADRSRGGGRRPRGGAHGCSRTARGPQDRLRPQPLGGERVPRLHPHLARRVRHRGARHPLGDQPRPDCGHRGRRRGRLHGGRPGRHRHAERSGAALRPPLPPPDLRVADPRRDPRGAPRGPAPQALHRRREPALRRRNGRGADAPRARRGAAAGGPSGRCARDRRPPLRAGHARPRRPPVAPRVHPLHRDHAARGRPAARRGGRRLVRRRGDARRPAGHPVDGARDGPRLDRRAGAAPRERRRLGAHVQHPAPALDHVAGDRPDGRGRAHRARAPVARGGEDLHGARRAGDRRRRRLPDAVGGLGRARWPRSPWRSSSGARSASRSG